MPNDLPTRRLAWSDIPVALGWGYQVFRVNPGVSIVYAAIFALPGLFLLIVIGLMGLSPMALPAAGGFMLIGPVLLTGYFAFARQAGSGTKPRLNDAWLAFRQAPPALWLLALVCAFLFLVWITDAGVLYSMTLGGEHLPYDYALLWQSGQSILNFEIWGSLMGAMIAFMIFALSAFSVPLIHEHRFGIVDAVHVSVRTVFGNFTVCLGWGCVLGMVIVVSVLLLPLLLVTLPVMSYASFGLYRAAFPIR